jgi:hypothetical protein
MEARQSANAEFIGFCSLQQTLRNDRDYEWYRLYGDHSLFEFTGDYTINGVRLESLTAYKVPQTEDLVHGVHLNSYVSERFKAFVEDSGFTGLDFLWLKDTGKYKARQWYDPIPQCPIGKGVDHPWFDPSKLEGSDSRQPNTEPYRTGVYHFSNAQLRHNAPIGAPTKRIVELFSDVALTIITSRRHLRRYLPATDFAFSWHQEDSVDKDGRPLRQRDICVNLRAAKALLGAITKTCG